MPVALNLRLVESLGLGIQRVDMVPQRAEEREPEKGEDSTSVCVTIAAVQQQRGWGRGDTVKRMSGRKNKRLTHCGLFQNLVSELVCRSGWLGIYA